MQSKIADAMEKKVVLNGKHLYFDDLGNGPAVLILHGFLESKEIWTELAQALSSKYRVICPDLPGHGKSELVVPIATMEHFADSAKGLLNHLGIRKCILLGHSMGGYAALAFAELYPQYLQAFGLIHSHPNADNEAKTADRLADIALVEKGGQLALVERNIPRLFANENLERLSHQVERWKRIAMNTPGDGIIASIKGMAARPDRNEVLEKLTIPGLFLFGKSDNLIQNEVGLSAEKRHSHLRTVWLKNSGHLGFIEEPQLTKEVLTTFIKTATLKSL